MPAGGDLIDGHSRDAPHLDHDDRPAEHVSPDGEDIAAICGTLKVDEGEQQQHLKNESLFYIVMPLERIDFHITGYWTSSIWSL